MQTVNLLGVDFDDLDVRDVVAMLLERHGGARFAYIVTPNADHLARLRRLPQLRRVYDAAWLRLLDSRMLKNAALGLGLHAPQVATGADLTAALLAALPAQEVAIIGLAPEFLGPLAARYPHLRFAHHNPPADLLHDRAGLAQARDFALRTRAAFTFIAVGSPVQELLAYAILRAAGGVGVGLCVGAALEFCAGARRRAPGWMRHAGLEWLHRLATEPKRLGRRYLLDDPPVMFDLVSERFSRIVPRSLPGPHPRSARVASAASDPCPPPRRARLHEIPDAG